MMPGGYKEKDRLSQCANAVIDRLIMLLLTKRMHEIISRRSAGRVRKEEEISYVRSSSRLQVSHSLLLAPSRNQ
jgi:hypothetical protein